MFLRMIDASCRSGPDIMVFPQRVPRLFSPEHLGSESMPRTVRGSHRVPDRLVLRDEVVVVGGMDVRPLVRLMTAG